MTAEAKPTKKKDNNFIPYSLWSQTMIDNIKILVDECLDRFKEDKKTNTEILKLLSKLEDLIRKKYGQS